MDLGTIAAASASVSAQQRLDAIAHNLANAGTPGFKAQLLRQWADRPAAGPGTANAVSTPLSRSRLHTDFGQGPLQPTGNPLDLALSGPGFFVVSGPEGERLTRRGSFTLDADGYLATTDGQRVQGEAGDLRIGDAAARGDGVQAAADGTLMVGGTSAGKLRVVTVSDPQALAREGATLFAPRGQVPANAAPGSYEVRKGTLEGANVSPVESLAALIETMRGFEAYMTAVSRLDEATSRAIGEVARV